MNDPDAEITPDWQIPWPELKEWARIGGGNFGNVCVSLPIGAFCNGVSLMLLARVAATAPPIWATWWL